MSAKQPKPEIIVRPVQPQDAADLYAIVAHRDVARWLVQLPSMEISETERWLAKPAAGRHRLVAEVEGNVVGSCNLRHYQNPRARHAGRIGLMVHPGFWNQGVGSALVATALDLADNWLNLLRVELEVLAQNAGAIHLYEKFGFEHEGQRRCAVFGGGQWLDELQMARLRNTDGLVASDMLPSALPARSQRNIDSLEIRPFRREDVPDLYHIYCHPRVDQTTMQLPSIELSQLAEKLSDDSPLRYRFVAVADGVVAGLSSIHRDQNPRMNHTAGLGMMVHPDYWGLGIGSRLMEALLDITDNWLALKRLDLEVNTDNPAATHLYQRFGFEIEGTKRFHVYGAGRWANSFFMSRLRLDL